MRIGVLFSDDGTEKLQKLSEAYDATIYELLEDAVDVMYRIWTGELDDDE